MVYTASFAFFEAIWDAGVRYCFVNLGSDHPSILEAIVKGQRERKDRFPKIITCPNEMVALSLADGYARQTNQPQCVIVHVDVGTQGLGAAVHNASTGRAPVLIFAGLSPHTLEGEMRGSRTEYIHWIQDVPDQKQVVAQYCRWTGEVRSGRNVKQLVNRALSFAMSDPKGPVYLVGSREAMEEDLEPYALEQAFWRPVEPAALPADGVRAVAEALVNAEEPLVATGYVGRNPKAVGLLVELADLVPGLRVVDTAGSDMCFPADHPSWLGLRFGVDDSIRTADTILVLDNDVPWINTQCVPSSKARIFHIDVDPLKQQMPVFYINALARYLADAAVALRQILDFITGDKTLKETLERPERGDRRDKLKKAHGERIREIVAKAEPGEDNQFGTGYLMKRVREIVPRDAIWCVEAVTQTVFVSDQVRATIPGSWQNCGGGGLGWSGGASLGMKLASLDKGEDRMVIQVVGDGTFIFTIPTAVYWLASRYSIPTLTIVLNNAGWHAPRRSLLLVHPDGEGSTASMEELAISLAPTPDYAGVAKAASGGKIWAGRVGRVEELDRVLEEAVEVVRKGGSAVVDACLDGPKGKYSGVEVENVR